METKLKELKIRLLEINDLESAAAVLGWDQRSYMPPGGATARARQTGTLRRLAHEKFTDLARRMSEEMPASELRLIPRSGHSIHLENPFAWLAAVRTFQP